MTKKKAVRENKTDIGQVKRRKLKAEWDSTVIVMAI